ncbi:MAG: hypothetical protein AAB035_05485, partial [Nitrospirota bacterium]
MYRLFFGLFAFIVLSLSGCNTDKNTPQLLSEITVRTASFDCSGTDVDRGNRLRDAIETAASSTTIQLCAGVHEVGLRNETDWDGIRIGPNIRGLTIQGFGKSSIVKFQRPVYFGFGIFNQVT